MKRLLIITYYWPPTGGSGVQRWVKFSKYLPQYGWQPVVYTPENPEQLAVDESLAGDIPPCAEVLKTRIVEPYALYRKLFRHSGGGEVNPLNSQKKSLAKRLSLWARGNLFIPDPRVSWVKPSVKFLEKYLREHPVDAVVTTGPPQSMHLIGLGLKRRTGVKWIADFRDPWTRMFYYKHLELSRCADRKHRRLEQTVLDSADLVISVSPQVGRDFAAATTTPVCLITNGFDEDDYAAGNVAPRHDGKFRIVHTGLFAADGNPLNLWDALAARCAADTAFRSCLEIRLAGKTDSQVVSAIESRGLGGNLVNLGYLPHKECVAEQRTADVLLLPLRREPEYAKVLPGKIFEYLAAGRPVLGIGDEGGAADEILQQAGAGRMFGWDSGDGLVDYLIGASAAPEGVEKFSRCLLTRRLVEELDKLT